MMRARSAAVAALSRCAPHHAAAAASTFVAPVRVQLVRPVVARAACVNSLRFFSAAPSQPEAEASVNPHAARKAAAAAGTSATPPAAKPVVASSAFTAPPTEMPPFVPLSQVDLATHEPRLAKHSVHGWLIYQSAMEKAVRAVKAFSLTSAAMAILSAPVMLVLANPEMPMAGRVAIAGTVVAFGISTTIALTYFTRSYVIRVFAKQAKPMAAAAPTVAGASTEAADEAAARNWILTVETLNMFGRPVHTVAPHTSFHPLFSRVFNNVRVESSASDAAAFSPPLQPVKKDLFVHMDQATNPLMLPLWAKPTVVASGKAIDLGDGSAPLGITDRVTLSLKQATEKLEEINKQQAAKKAAEEAAATAAAAEGDKKQ